MKKYILFLLFLTVVLSCKNTDSENTKKIQVLKDFYLENYSPNQVNDRVVDKKYLSERILKRIDSLSSGEDLIMDYDPFIKGQDYDGEVIKKTLQIEPLDGKNAFRVSFLLFGTKDEKRKVIDLSLCRDSNDNYLIDSVLNDDYLDFETP